MPDRLAVMRRFRGHQVGRFLLERARALADSRGSKMLYMRVAPQHADYFEEQGWRRLDGKPGAGSSLALVWPIGPDDTQNDLNTTDAVELWARYGRGARRRRRLSSPDAGGPKTMRNETKCYCACIADLAT